MNFIKKITLTAAAVGLGLGFFEGCTTSPTAPNTNNDQDTTQIDTTQTDTTEVDTTVIDTPFVEPKGTLYFNALNPSGSSRIKDFQISTPDSGLTNLIVDLQTDGDTDMVLTLLKDDTSTISGMYQDTGLHLATIYGENLITGLKSKATEWVYVAPRDSVDLGNYPAPFVENGILNCLMVIGVDSDPINNIAMTNIATGLYQPNDSEHVAIEVGSAVFDTEVASLYDQNTIIIGTPCDNRMAAAFEEKEYQGEDCLEGLVEGQAMIKLKKFGDYIGMLVTGYTPNDVRRAGMVLNQYQSYALEGKEVTITGTDFENITVGE